MRRLRCLFKHMNQDGEGKDGAHKGRDRPAHRAGIDVGRDARRHRQVLRSNTKLKKFMKGASRSLIPSSSLMCLSSMNGSLFGPFGAGILCCSRGCFLRWKREQSRVPNAVTAAVFMGRSKRSLRTTHGTRIPAECLYEIPGVSMVRLGQCGERLVLRP